MSLPPWPDRDAACERRAVQHFMSGDAVSGTTQTSANVQGEPENQDLLSLLSLLSQPSEKWPEPIGDEGFHVNGRRVLSSSKRRELGLQLLLILEQSRKFRIIDVGDHCLLICKENGARHHAVE